MRVHIVADTHGFLDARIEPLAAGCGREATPWVLNPGAAGRSRTFGGPSCLLLAAASDGWEVTLHRFEPIAAVRAFDKGRDRSLNGGP